MAAGPSTLLPLLVTTGVFAAEAASVTAQVCSVQRRRCAAMQKLRIVKQAWVWHLVIENGY